jgi:penicillin G amidase
MASWWQKTVLVASGLAGLIGGTYYLVARRPLPRRRGRLHLQGLHEPVEIITDRYGVPHVYAQNEDDLFFAQGFVHAQERLWQMELNRRISSGRLAEIFGEVALEADRFSRRLGMHRAAAAEMARLSAHNKRILEAYARGVNSFIESHRRRLPLEFTLLRFKPAAWHISDSIQWAKLMGWNLCGNFETEIIRARIIAILGVKRAAALEAGYDPAHPLIIPPGVAYAGVNPGILEQYEQVKQLAGFGLLGASNNWVVDGTMSSTGAPLLCNDPHLGQAAPSVWYECHLAAGDIDVIGASFPGAPGIVIGHNRHIAWGITNAVSDVQDLYIERFNPLNPRQYEYQGKWEEAQIVREEIKVRGRKAVVVEEVRITRHGPILSNLAGEGAGRGDSAPAAVELPLALRWTGLEQCNVIAAVGKINLATNWEEFRAALYDWDVPPQNLIYADREGNIGYVMAGAIPMRARGQNLVPVPGWTGEYEWTDMIPFDELPQVYNPQQHFIVTANNRVVNDDYPYYITNEWLNGYRAQRIRDLLTARTRLTPGDMAQIQADQYALPAVEIVPHILSITTTDPLERAAQEILRTWNYILAPASAGAALYTTFLYKLERIVYAALLGKDESLIHAYLGRGSTILALTNGYASRNKPHLIRLLARRDDSWFADSAVTNGPRTWDAACGYALSAAVAELRAQLGDNVAGWRYGDVHRMTYNHPLGSIKPLARLFKRGPFPVGGDIDTVNMGAALPHEPQTVVTVPSYRQIVDLGDIQASLSGHAPGQSGHPASKHYADFIKPWLRVEHHPMLFERGSIEAAAEGSLELLPA